MHMGMLNKFIYTKTLTYFGKSCDHLKGHKIKILDTLVTLDTLKF
jgi:hypothetical protein